MREIDPENDWMRGYSGGTLGKRKGERIDRLGGMELKENIGKRSKREGN